MAIIIDVIISGNVPISKPIHTVLSRSDGSLILFLIREYISY